MKLKLYKVFYAAALLLLLAFCAATCMDYVNYTASLNSAPFRVFVLVNAMVFLVPDLLCLFLGYLFKKWWKP